MEKSSQAHGLENLDSFFGVSKQGPCFTVIEGDGGDKRLVELELACKADGVATLDPLYYFSLAILPLLRQF